MSEFHALDALPALDGNRYMVMESQPQPACVQSHLLSPYCFQAAPRPTVNVTLYIKVTLKPEEDTIKGVFHLVSKVGPTLKQELMTRHKGCRHKGCLNMKKKSVRIHSNQIICSSSYVRQLSSGCVKSWCLPVVVKAAGCLLNT